jgi:hypothetical protein
MTDRHKVFIVAQIPPELERAFLQHIRDFDITHPGCNFEMGIDAPDIPIAEAVEQLRIDPSLTFTTIFEWGRK